MTFLVQAAHNRAEGLQRDNLSLKSQLSVLTEQTQASGTDAESSGRTPEATPGGSLASSRWCMSGSSGQSAGGEALYSGALGGAGDSVLKTDAAKMKALRSGDSVDARSQKSDHLTGDEMDNLGGQKSSSPSNAGSGYASPIKHRAGDGAQRLNRCVIHGSIVMFRFFGMVTLRQSSSFSCTNYATPHSL